MGLKESSFGGFIYRVAKSADAWIPTFLLKSPKPTEDVLKFLFHSRHLPFSFFLPCLFLSHFTLTLFHLLYFIHDYTFLMNLTISFSNAFLFVFCNFHLSKFKEHLICRLVCEVFSSSLFDLVIVGWFWENVKWE